VFLELQNGKKGSFIKSWMLGMVKGLSMSFCYGTPTAPTCLLKVDATGTVHFLGAAYFHGKVGYVKMPSNVKKTKKGAKKKVAKKKVKKKKIAAKKKLKKKKALELGERRDAGAAVKLDARLDTEAVNNDDGELSSSQIGNKVWWNGEALSLLQMSKPATAPGYHTKIGGAGPQMPAGKWKALNGKVSIRLESQNALRKKNVYIEMRNNKRRDAWGVGLKKDGKFHIGYGMLGSFKEKNEFVKLSPSKDVTFTKNVVFNKLPSYFKKGKKLSLTGYAAAAAVPQNPAFDPKFKAKTKSALGVPDPPTSSKDKIGTNADAQPIVAYHSEDNVSIRLTAESTGALKEAFVEFRSQKNMSWRIAVHSDGHLYLTYHAAGSAAAGTKVLKLTTKGGVHVYGSAYFGGKTMKNF